MNELELIKHAKSYIDKMANGIDPLTNEPVPDSDLINNVRIARCLFFVSGILDQVVNGKDPLPKKHKAERAPFAITLEELGKFEYCESGITISEIAKRINACLNDDRASKIRYSDLYPFMFDCGLLETAENINGKKMRAPTSAGKDLGIYMEEREGSNGRYLITLYNIEAQHFIIDNLFKIIERYMKGAASLQN